MSEGEGLVVVKGVDDVGIGKGFEDEEILEAGPVRAGGDDGVLGAAWRMASTTVASMPCQRYGSFCSGSFMISKKTCSGSMLAKWAARARHRETKLATPVAPWKSSDLYSLVG